MSTGARKARKRAGVKFTKPVKRPTLARVEKKGLGLIGFPEWFARALASGRDVR